MFVSVRKPQTRLGSALAMSEVIYHSTVRSVRQKHNNAFVAIALEMSKSVLMVAAFYVLFMFMGLTGAGIRGDFILYIMSGIFLFMTHIQAVSAVMSAQGPTSPMMQHAPMNTVVSIVSEALAALYIQIICCFCILFIYHVAFTPLIIDQIMPTFGMLVLSWFSGCAIGLVLLSLKPWAPSFIPMLMLIYQRANMLASGKMFVANTLPGFLISAFDWNPLFHTIDQARGFAFVNYTPHHTNWEYAFWFSIVFLALGLLGEFYTRKFASASWGAKL